MWSKVRPLSRVTLLINCWNPKEYTFLLKGCIFKCPRFSLTSPMIVVGMSFSIPFPSPKVVNGFCHSRSRSLVFRNDSLGFLFPKCGNRFLSFHSRSRIVEIDLFIPYPKIRNLKCSFPFFLMTLGEPLLLRLVYWGLVRNDRQKNKTCQIWKITTKTKGLKNDI